MSWYKRIYVKINNNKNSIKEILNWISDNYFFDSEMLEVNEKENSITLNGEEYNSFYKKETPKRLPNVECIFKEISIAFPFCEYIGEVKIHDNRSNENEQYFITCEKGIIKITIPLLASVCYVDEYEDYDEFCDEYEDVMNEKEFNKYKKDNEIIYICEKEVYTEEEYYNRCKVIFCENINDTISFSKEENIDKDKLLEQIAKRAQYMEEIPEKLKSDRNFVLEAVRKNGFSIIHLNNDLALDREIALEAVKSDPYVVDFLKGELRNDEELKKISESILETFDEEN